MDSCGPFELPPEWDRPSATARKKGKKDVEMEPRKAWIIIMVDYFTKVAEFAVVLDHSAETAASAFYDHWLSRYPRPLKVTTDNGTENLGAMDLLLKQLGIKHVTTATFNPTANGAAERLVGHLKSMLARMVGTHVTGWMKVLPHVRAAYMRKVHRTTGFAPIHMLTGKQDQLLIPLGDLLPDIDVGSVKTWSGHFHLSEMVARTRTDIDVLSHRDYAFALQSPGLIHVSVEEEAPRLEHAVVGVVFIPEELDEHERSLQLDDLVRSQFAVTKYMTDMESSRQRIYAEATKRVSKAQRGHRERYLRMLDKRSAAVTYDIRPGSFVLVRHENAKGLRAPLFGPFEVVRITEKGNFILKTGEAGTMRAAQTWMVGPDRVYPYTYDYHCWDSI